MVSCATWESQASWLYPKSRVARTSLFNMASQSSGSKRIFSQVWEQKYTLVGHSAALSAPHRVVTGMQISWIWKLSTIKS